MVAWKDQLLQHCIEHESAMRQYCVEVDSAMSQQEQRLLGQAANNLQQRDAALSALHRVEEEVLHLKGCIAVSSAAPANSQHAATRLQAAWSALQHALQRFCLYASAGSTSMQTPGCDVPAGVTSSDGQQQQCR